MFTAENVTKNFPGGTDLGPLNLQAAAGEVVLLAGANGSGKTTALRMASGILRPTGGSFSITGRRDYAGHAAMLFPLLTIDENLQLFLDGANIDAELNAWGLTAIRQRPFGGLSKGQQAKVSLARAFAPRPEVLLLDEPSSNLDDYACELLCAQIEARHESGLLTIMATHDLARLLPLATRMIVLQGGRVISDESKDAIGKAADIYRSINR